MAFENNVQATLHTNVAVGATTVAVVKAVAPNKDVPASGRLTLSATGKIEIISYTGRTDNTTYWTLTGVTKNAESSFGDQAWSAGDACFQALTAADVASLQGATGACWCYWCYWPRRNSRFSLNQSINSPYFTRPWATVV